MAKIRAQRLVTKLLFTAIPGKKNERDSINMLITFKTKSYANITMFGEVGLKMLEMIDYGVKIPGGIVAADVGHALQNLQQGLASLPPLVEPTGEVDDEQLAVALQTRAVPLLELLHSAVTNENDVRWE